MQLMCLVCVHGLVRVARALCRCDFATGSYSIDVMMHTQSKASGPPPAIPPAATLLEVAEQQKQLEQQQQHQQQPADVQAAPPLPDQHGKLATATEGPSKAALVFAVHSYSLSGLPLQPLLQIFVLTQTPSSLSKGPARSTTEAH